MPGESTRLIDEVLASLKRARLSYDDRVVVGLSGGIDSLTLTHILFTLRDAGDGPSLQAVHVDHGLRPTSAQDANSVARLACTMGVPVEVVRADVSDWETGRGTEAAARDARYAALASVAARIRAEWVLLGHTLDDQAETVLLRLSRGTALDGLTGMREISQRSIALNVDGKSSVAIQILRPLLHSRRAEIEAYARLQGLQPVEDESNRDVRFRRNAIRHQILPALEQITPGATAAIARTIGLLQADADFASAEAGRVLSEIVAPLGSCIVLQREPFRPLALSLQRRVLAKAVNDLARHIDLTSERIEVVRAAVLSGAASSVVQLGGGLDAYVDYDRVVFGPTDEIASTLRRASLRPLLSPGSSIEMAQSAVIAVGDRWHLDVRVAASDGWLLRTRLPGDRVRLASGRTQRLQDWFVNRRVPRYLRDYVPLLVRDGTIRWVIGFSSADFEDVDSGIVARLRERSVEDR